MKCNTPKPPKLPKSWHRLPEYERQEILKIANLPSHNCVNLMNKRVKSFPNICSKCNIDLFRDDFQPRTVVLG